MTYLDTVQRIGKPQLSGTKFLFKFSWNLFRHWGDVAVRGTRRGRRDTEHNPTRCGETPADWALRLWGNSREKLGTEWSGPLTLEEACWLLNMSPIKTPTLFAYFSVHGGQPCLLVYPLSYFLLYTCGYSIGLPVQAGDCPTWFWLFAFAVLFMSVSVCPFALVPSVQMFHICYFFR